MTCSSEIQAAARPAHLIESRRFWRVLIPLVLVLLLSMIWWQVGSFGYINFDDPWYVGNAEIRKGLSLEGVKFAFASTGPVYPHPVTLISHMLDFELFGDNAGMHHAVNVFLHIANSLLLLYFLSIASGEFWKSAAVTFLFAFHPLRVESVAWVAERKDVLSTFFALASLCSYVLYTKGGCLSWYLATLGLFMLGVLAKPMVVTLPALFWLLDIWPLQRVHPSKQPSGSWTKNVLSCCGQFLRLGIEKIPLFALSFGYSALCIFVMHDERNFVEAESLPLGTRILAIAPNYAAYIGKMFWPTNLSILYPHPGQWSVAELTASYALLAIISVIVIVCSFKGLLFVPIGWLWFVGITFPVSGLLQNGGQSIADRFTYLPSIGITIMVVWGISLVARRYARVKPAIILLSVIVIGLLASLTSAYIPSWRSSETVYKKGLASVGNSFVLHLNLAGHYLEIGSYQKALESASMASQMLHRNESLGSKAAALTGLGREDEAFDLYERMLLKDPFNKSANAKVGIILASQGRMRDSIAFLIRAVQGNPNDPNLYLLLAKSLASIGRSDLAEKYATRGFLLAPDDPGAVASLWQILKDRAGRAEVFDAFVTLTSTLKAPSRAHVVCGLFSMDQGEFADAIQHFEFALRIDPDNRAAEIGLAETCIISGKVDEGVAWLLKATQNDPQAARTLLKFSLLLSTHAQADVRKRQEAELIALNAIALLGEESAFAQLILANAKAAQSKFHEAIQICNHAEELADESANLQLKGLIRNAKNRFLEGKLLAREFFPK